MDIGDDGHSLDHTLSRSVRNVRFTRRGAVGRVVTELFDHWRVGRGRNISGGNESVRRPTDASDAVQRRCNIDHDGSQRSTTSSAELSGCRAAAAEHVRRQRCPGRRARRPTSSRLVTSHPVSVSVGDAALAVDQRLERRDHHGRRHRQGQFGDLPSEGVVPDQRRCRAAARPVLPGRSVPPRKLPPDCVTDNEIIRGLVLVE